MLKTPPPGIPSQYWNIPALPPPNGQQSLFEDGETRAPDLIAINAVFLSFMVTAVTMRFFVWQKGKDKFDWGFVALLVAAVATIAHGAIIFTCLEFGYGRHMWDIRALELTHDRLITMSQIFLTYTMSVGSAKLSVLLLYRRFFKMFHFTNMLIWFGIIFNVLFTIAYMGVTIAETVVCNGPAVTRKCTKDSKIEECVGLATPPIAFCYHSAQILTAQAGINFLLDFFILFIPLQQVYNLKVEKRRKIGVAAVFGVGFMACIASTARFALTLSNIHQTDLIWNGVLSDEPAVAEMNIFIIAPCLVFLPAFIKFSRTGFSTLTTRLLGTHSSCGVKTGTSKEQSHDGSAATIYSNELKQQRSVELMFMTDANRNVDKISDTV